jgi:hypothetical protein
MRGRGGVEDRKGMTTLTIPANCLRMRRLSRALTTVAATGATYTVWTVAHQVAGIDLLLKDGSTVTPAAVVATTVMIGLAAWSLLAVLEHFTRHARTIWSWTAGAFLLISLAGPFTATSPAAITALMTMHLAAAAVLIPLLHRSAVHSRRPR